MKRFGTAFASATMLTAVISAQQPAPAAAALARACGRALSAQPRRVRPDVRPGQKLGTLGARTINSARRT